MLVSMTAVTTAVYEDSPVPPRKTPTDAASCSSCLAVEALRAAPESSAVHGLLLVLDVASSLNFFFF